MAELPGPGALRLLFVCSRNRLRSPTAEHLFSTVAGIESASAGLDHDADTPLTGDLLEWADIVFVMERSHVTRLNRRFRAQLRGKEVHVLGIPDRFDYMDPQLVSVLERRVHGHLRGRLSQRRRDP